MKSSRKAKRYDDSVLPGDFHGYDQFEREDLAGNGLLFGEIRRNGRSVDVGQLALVTNSPRKQSFAKLRSKAETLSREATYLAEVHTSHIDGSSHSGALAAKDQFNCWHVSGSIFAY